MIKTFCATCFFFRGFKTCGICLFSGSGCFTLLKADKIAVGWVIGKIVLPFCRRAGLR